MIRPLLPWAIAIIVVSAILGFVFIVASVRALNRYNRWGSGWDLAEGAVFYIGSLAFFFMLVFAFIKGR